MSLRLLCAVLPLSALLVGCGSAEGGDGDQARDAEPSAFVSCRHFRNVVGDLDVLSPDEIREKVREVHEKARVSDEPGIAPSARAMLAAATADDGEGFVQSVGEMSAACRDLGL